MPEQYGHLLIPEDDFFVCRPSQMEMFLEHLVKEGAAPLEGKLTVMKPTGKFRSFLSPFSGRRQSRPILEHIPVGKISDLGKTLQGLEYCDIEMSGGGPASVPLLQLEYCGEQFGRPKAAEQSLDKDAAGITWDDSYKFSVVCSLRPEPVSTSSRNTEGSEVNAPSFGQPCTSSNRVGFFEHPRTGAVIEVPNAGCARFWIEFRFGKWLFPKISDSLNLLEPSIVKLTAQCFGTKFAQGCRVYA